MITRLPIVFVMALASLAAMAESSKLAAPNVVAITPRLVTAGQPSAKALAELREQGFEAVVYLAPPTVSDAIRDEALIVGRQGLVFVNIPIRFDNPTEQDFEAFASVLQALSKRKVLVHCQINLRASSMVFLYRAIVGKEDPNEAYKAVASVWSPHDPWKGFIQAQLRKHAVNFETY